MSTVTTSMPTDEPTLSRGAKNRRILYRETRSWLADFKHLPFAVRWLASPKAVKTIPERWRTDDFNRRDAITRFVSAVGVLLATVAGFIIILFSPLTPWEFLGAWAILPKLMALGNSTTLIGLVYVSLVWFTYANFQFLLTRQTEREEQQIPATEPPWKSDGSLAAWERNYYAAKLTTDEFKDLMALPGDLVRDLYGQAKWNPTPENLDWAQQLFTESLAQGVNWEECLKLNHHSLTTYLFAIKNWIREQNVKKKKDAEYRSLAIVVPYLLKTIPSKFRCEAGDFMPESSGLSSTFWKEEDNAQRNRRAIILAACSLAGENIFQSYSLDLIEQARLKLEPIVLSQLRKVELNQQNG